MREMKQLNSESQLPHKSITSAKEQIEKKLINSLEYFI